MLITTATQAFINPRFVWVNIIAIRLDRFCVRGVREDTFRLIYAGFSSDGIGNTIVSSDDTIVRESVRHVRYYQQPLFSDGTIVSSDSSLSLFFASLPEYLAYLCWIGRSLTVLTVQKPHSHSY